eukprot:PITA_30970
MEKLLKKEEYFMWTKAYQVTLNKLKEKLVNTPILVYPKWNKQLHIHIDALGITLGAVLVQHKERNMDHPIYFASRKLSTIKKNYTTIVKEALAMVYSLQKFRHYLLGVPFKFFTDHSNLKYLLNNPVLEGRICQWLLLFQEFTFKLVIKMGRLNVGPEHLSRLESGENEGPLDDQLPDADLFQIEAIPNYLEEIVVLLTTGYCWEGYTSTQKRHLIRIEKPSHWDELPLNPIHTVQIFDKCVVDFISPIMPQAHHSDARYIITATEYLTRWVEEAPVKDCTIDTVARFIFECIISRF